MEDIDDLRFFRIVDDQVSQAMQQAETTLLPVARQAVADTHVRVQAVPVEGYYGKTPQLTEYFQLIRALQSNQSDVVTDAVRRLHTFYTHDAFGIGQAVATAINANDVYYPNMDPVVISPVVDPLTRAVSAVLGDATDPAIIRSVLTMKNLGDVVGTYDLKGLVGFGVFVDDVLRKATGQYDPCATTLARETTVLSAYVPLVNCIPQYRVTPAVEEKGNEIITAYNAAFEMVGLESRIPAVTQRNAFGLNGDLPKMQRCVRIFTMPACGDAPPLSYHWAVIAKGDEIEYDPHAVEFWADQVVTTDKFRTNPDRYVTSP